MSADEEDKSGRDIEQDMNNEAERMQRHLDELDEHVKEARKKAEDIRQEDLPGDDAVETAAGDAADRSTSSDDPVSAVGDPEDADD
jgi:hypothetical protein